MKGITLNAILLSLTLSLTTTLCAQNKAQACSEPSVLHVSKIGNELYYQLDNHQQHKLYTLGELSDAVRNCSPDRMLFVVADPNVSPTEMWTPAKEQITNVRYFVQFQAGDLVEIKFGLIFRKLPLTPDVKGEPLDDDTPPPPSKIPRGSK